MNQPSQRSFASAVFWNTAIMTVVFPLSVATSVVIGRVLGPAGKGEYTLAMLVAALLFTALNFGIPAAISYATAGGQAPDGSLVKTLSVAAVVLAAAGIFICVILDRTGWCRYVFGVPRLGLAVWLLVLALPFQFLGAFLQFFVLAKGRSVLFALVPAVGQVVVSLSVAMLVLVQRITAPAAAAASAASYVVTASILLIHTSRRVSWIQAPLLQREPAGRLARYSLTNHLAGVLLFLIQRADVFMISVFLDLSAVGLYSVAYSIAELLLLLPQRFGNLFLPRVAGQLQQGKSTDVALSSSLVFVGAVIAAAALSLAAPLGIRLLYGDAFAPSTRPLLLLLPGVCALSASQVQHAYLSGAGRVGTTAAIPGIGLGINVLLNLFLIPRFGISGAAIASSLTYCTQAFLLMSAVARMTNSTRLAMIASAPPAVLLGLVKRAFHRML